MAIHVEHEIHQRRKGRNFGILGLLLLLVVLVFGLTVVKVTELGDAKKFESFDRVVRTAIIPEEGASE